MMVMISVRIVVMAHVVVKMMKKKRKLMIKYVN